MDKTPEYAKPFLIRKLPAATLAALNEWADDIDVGREQLVRAILNRATRNRIVHKQATRIYRRRFRAAADALAAKKEKA